MKFAIQTFHLIFMSAFLLSACDSQSNPKDVFILAVADKGQDQELILINATTGESAPWTEGLDSVSCASVSPDGSKLAFTSQRDGNLDIYIAQINNTELSTPINITNTLLLHEGCPASWSPDSSRIVFSAIGEGYVKGDQIYTIDLDTSEQTQLTQDETITWGDPAWSPDGKQIAVSAQRIKDEEIYLINTDGTNPIQISESFAVNNAYLRTITSPAWSPDGTRIAFLSYSDGSPDIITLNVNGDNKTTLSLDLFSASSLAWTPDGKQFLFRGNKSFASTSNLYTTTINDGGVTTLLPGQLNNNFNLLRPFFVPENTLSSLPVQPAQISAPQK